MIDILLLVLIIAIVSYLLGHWCASQEKPKHKKDCNCPDCINYDYGVPL